MVGVDAGSVYRGTHSLSRLAWSLVSGHLAPFYIHQMNWVNSCNGSAMMTAPQTCLGYYYYYYINCCHFSANLVGWLGSGHCLMGQIGSGVWISVCFCIFCNACTANNSLTLQALVV